MKRGSMIAWGAVIAACNMGTFGLAERVDFESVPHGTIYGEVGLVHDSPGDVVLLQDGIAMSVEEFLFDASVFFYKAEVGGVYEKFFDSTPLQLNNISVKFDFTGLPFDVSLVTAEYVEFLGRDNFSVNGGTIYQTDSLTDIPSNIAPGITATVADGLLTLSADDSFFIENFQIGGQELILDNILAVPEVSTLALLALGGGSLLRRRRRGI